MIIRTRPLHRRVLRLPGVIAAHYRLLRKHGECGRLLAFYCAIMLAWPLGRFDIEYRKPLFRETCTARDLNRDAEMRRCG